MQQQQPNNVETKATGKQELRKLWDITQAQHVYALFGEYETTIYKDEKKDKILEVETKFYPEAAGRAAGDKEWAERTAEHFNLTVPEEEYQDDETVVTS